MAIPGQNDQYFAKQRELATQKAQSQGQENSGAIARRFAAMGGSNSGAALKAQELNDQQTGQAQQEALQGVGGQELQARQTEQGQQFQSAEAEKQRQFQGQESAAQRQQQQGQFGQTLDLEKQQLAFDREDQAFNKGLSALQAGVPLDFGAYIKGVGVNWEPVGRPAATGFGAVGKR